MLILRDLTNCDRYYSQQRRCVGVKWEPLRSRGSTQHQLIIAEMKDEKPLGDKYRTFSEKVSILGGRNEDWMMWVSLTCCRHNHCCCCCLSSGGFLSVECCPSRRTPESCSTVDSSFNFFIILTMWRTVLGCKLEILTFLGDISGWRRCKILNLYV